jgi:hypothetical protein
MNHLRKLGLASLLFLKPESAMRILAIYGGAEASELTIDTLPEPDQQTRVSR